MAKIVEDVLVVKFSKIVKDNTDGDLSVIENDSILALEQVAQELAGEGVVVEVLRA
jgi:hypothetical protein